MVAMVAESRDGDAYDYEELRKENALLWEANTHLQQKVAERDQEVVYLRNQLDFHRDWRKQIDGLEQEVLTSGEKATTTAIYRMIRSQEITPNADGYYLVEPWRVGKATGYSATSTRGHINNVSDIHEDGKPDKLAIVPLFDKRLVKIPDENAEGGFTEATYLKPLAHLPYPLDYRHVARKLRPIGGAGRGQGRKPKCEKCGGPLQEKERIIDMQLYTLCSRCHITHVFPVQHMNDPLPVTDRLFFEPDMGNQLDFRIEPEQEEDDNQLDTVDPNSLHDQVDCQSDDPEPEGIGNQVDFHSDEEELVPEDPSIPPLPLDASQLESAACDLLLEIAGTGQEHIYMNRDPEEPGKYRTCHRKPHWGDMLAHLRGCQTKGAMLRHPFGMTRAICDDGDSPHDWKRLQEAAILLAQADFKPILEESPTQEGKHAGGGHLWVIFDKVVDAYSARQTLIAIAPMLEHSKEYWPHPDGVNCPPNVRLPGGKYVTQDGFQAWCKLSDAYGNELAHDGAGAARVLVEMQTPAALVKKHEEKTELVLTQEPITTHPTKPNSGGILGQKDVSQSVISEFNASHSWDELAAMAGGFNKAGYFPACWRGDNNPNVKVNPKTDLAKDFSTSAWLTGSMDKYQVWCFIEGRENHEAFKKQDLDQRCKAYRSRLGVAS